MARERKIGRKRKTRGGSDPIAPRATFRCPAQSKRLEQARVIQNFSLTKFIRAVKTEGLQSNLTLLRPALFLWCKCPFSQYLFIDDYIQDYPDYRHYPDYMYSRRLLS